MDIIYSMKREMLRRGFSPRTISSYCYCVKKFLNKYPKNIRYVSKKDIKDYLDNLAEKGGAGSSINLYFSALKFVLEEVLRRNINLNLKFSRIPKKYPTVLIQEETKNLINAIENKKYKLMIELMYSTGLRVSELVNLRVRDFEFNRNYGWVRKGKCRKDRVFIIAERLNKRLQNFIKENRISYDSYIFKGIRGHLSTKTVHVLIKQAAKKAGIKKNVHCHTLRHSFATHLIENGYSVTDIQNLLGHDSSQTTMMYVHMVNPKILSIKSSLDSL